MQERLICEKIDVRYDRQKFQPVSFLWHGKEYRIVEIVSEYQDWGFSPVAPRKRNWRMRRHRNYYIVRTKEGVFKIYLDRARGKREWILLSEVVE